jgi:hypothetical protein
MTGNLKEGRFLRLRKQNQEKKKTEVVMGTSEKVCDM